MVLIRASVRHGAHTHPNRYSCLVPRTVSVRTRLVPSQHSLRDRTPSSAAPIGKLIEWREVSEVQRVHAGADAVACLRNRRPSNQPSINDEQRAVVLDAAMGKGSASAKHPTCARLPHETIAGMRPKIATLVRVVRRIDASAGCVLPDGACVFGRTGAWAKSRCGETVSVLKNYSSD